MLLVLTLIFKVHSLNLKSKKGREVWKKNPECRESRECVQKLSVVGLGLGLVPIYIPTVGLVFHYQTFEEAFFEEAEVSHSW